jgi:hypothetical protein
MCESKAVFGSSKRVVMRRIAGPGKEILRNRCRKRSAFEFKAHHGGSVGDGEDGGRCGAG